MLHVLAVENYRSLRTLVLPLGRLTVVTGSNGSGKSSLYRALRLLAETGRGDLVASLAREGGLPSTLWAGPHELGRAVRSGEHAIEGLRRRGPVQLRLGFAGDDFGYAADLGLPAQSPSAFHLDPEIKRECLWSGPVLRPATLLADRRGPALRVRAEGVSWQSVPSPLASFDSMLTAFADPRTAPEMLVVRERLRDWRFYDHLRGDPESPARRMQVGTRSPVLADDGGNLAAALQTIREIGDSALLDSTVDDAFPGSRIEVMVHDGRFELAMHQHGLLRPLRAAELSEGTLRFLLLAAALLTPRPPELMVFNEPESSLHPDLLPALARLLAEGAGRSQTVVVTHSPTLTALLRDRPATQALELEKAMGETRVVGGADRPRWEWPAR